MDKLRMIFSKTGRAIYISHLDLMHTMQRAFKRAGFELKYSEGFNPRPNTSIILPLSVGASSICEIMDFKLQEDCDLTDFPEKLTAALPEGIKVLKVYEPTRKSAELKWLAVAGVFEYDERDPEEMKAGLEAYYAQDEIKLIKKTKRGVGETDIKPGIRSIAFEAGEKCVLVKAVVSAQEPTINPDLLASALVQNVPKLAPDFARFTRLEVYDKDMKIYR